MLCNLALGCPTYTNPPGTWFKQETDIITVGCKQNKRTWKMRCIGNNWIGMAGNCTEGNTVSELIYYSSHVKVQQTFIICMSSSPISSYEKSNLGHQVSSGGF